MVTPPSAAAVRERRPRRARADLSLLLGAYREGVRLGLAAASGDPHASVSDFRPSMCQDIDRFVDGHAPPELDEPQTLDWVRDTARDYVTATYDGRQYQAGFNPQKCGYWLNARRPQSGARADMRKAAVQPFDDDAEWLRTAREAI